MPQVRGNGLTFGVGVDAASTLGEPTRVIPALVESGHLMPNNYNASLRLAQMETEAGQYDAATAACDRGLNHVDGPLGRTWLLQTKADALTRKGDLVAARRAFEDALRAAQETGSKQAANATSKGYLGRKVAQ